MNFEFFIAKRINGKNTDNKFSKPIFKVATTAIALGIAVMIIAISIVSGFKKEIRDKVVGFGSHIQISAYGNNSSLELPPVNKQLIELSLHNIKGIHHKQVFATKAGVIKANDEIYGINLKGISTDYDWSFFKNKLLKGNILKIKKNKTTQGILISEFIAKKLKLHMKDKIRMFFIINNQLRGRIFIVEGIYNSGFEELDKTFALADIKHIQSLNKWDSNQIGGMELTLKDFDKIDIINNQIYSELDYTLNSKTIKELKPEIFDWLDFLNINIIIILGLMIFVAIINIISSLLIMILEHTQTIGTLKSIGLSNSGIRKIFLYNSSILLLKGLIWGNLIGISICLIQKYTGIIKLDQATYFVNQVPISINFIYITALNIGTIILCILMQIIPSSVITKIEPAKVVRYE